MAMILYIYDTETRLTSLSVIFVGNVCNAQASSCFILTVSWSLSADVSLSELDSDFMKSIITCNVMITQSFWQQCLPFWDEMQHRLVSYQRSGTTCPSHAPPSRVTTGLTCCLEISVTNYPSTLCNIPEEQRSRREAWNHAVSTLTACDLPLVGNG
jgi:hypothetical protein